MRLYLDACCYCRPFDDLRSDRVQLEADAVMSLLRRARAGSLEIAGGEALREELARIPDAAVRDVVFAWLEVAIIGIPFSSDLAAEADHLHDAGIRAFDALHVASAVQARADFFVTVDDRLLSRIARAGSLVPVRGANPLEMILRLAEPMP